MIYKSNIKYVFFKEPFKVFLESQTSEDKSTPLLAMKHYLLNLVIFLVLKGILYIFWNFLVRRTGIFRFVPYFTHNNEQEIQTN